MGLRRADDYLNLNFCQVVGVTGEQCLWSLLDPAGNPRPAYLAVEAMPK